MAIFKLLILYLTTSSTLFLQTVVRNVGVDLYHKTLCTQQKPQLALCFQHGTHVLCRLWRMMSTMWMTPKTPNSSTMGVSMLTRAVTAAGISRARASKGSMRALRLQVLFTSHVDTPQYAVLIAASVQPCMQIPGLLVFHHPCWVIFCAVQLSEQCFGL